MSMMAPAYDSAPEAEKFRCAAVDDKPTILTDIYREDVNIAIWQRKLPLNIAQSVTRLLQSNAACQVAMSVAPRDVSSSLLDCLGSAINSDLSEYIAELVDMFCCLFELEKAGLRLAGLDRAMCPRFHVDRVPCRLVTTFQGAGTDWIPHTAVNRANLGARNLDKNGNQCGVLRDGARIERLNPGDVALLKGELWQGNENAGLVHRSPSVSMGQARLLLTLDFSD